MVHGLKRSVLNMVKIVNMCHRNGDHVSSGSYFSELFVLMGDGDVVMKTNVDGSSHSSQTPCYWLWRVFCFD